MVCDGPDPPDNSPHDINPPSRHELMVNGHQEDSDDEQNDHFGYEPLPQGPESAPAEVLSEEDNESDPAQQAPPSDVPEIEPMDSVITRQVWNSPRVNDPIEMSTERAQQVMSIMANIALPQESIPEWAQSITEEQWKQTLNDRIEKMRNNR
ncbi:male-enhanced antigen 1 [Aricia agestis]|uniref:male-enhanced antigen 1 n=1 Tax=Aricia agestis TaxID=91739 RepID=UPI001C204DE0|nr:male-enhanced antigen 1 [Aricia agestis]